MNGGGQLNQCVGLSAAMNVDSVTRTGAIQPCRGRTCREGLGWGRYILPKAYFMAALHQPSIVRRGQDRGHYRSSWLDSFHTFSFGEYRDPQFMGIGPLRVINDDRIDPDKGFGRHPHKDMEIISYPLAGTIAHRDSTGGSQEIRLGEVQLMTAGSGIEHSEMNPSAEEEAHMLQIWIETNKKGLPPGYQQAEFVAESGQWQLLASPDGRGRSLLLHQDACLFDAVVQKGDSLSYELEPGRKAWLHVATGELMCAEVALTAGDAVGFEQAGTIHVHGTGAARALLFDLP